jgi:hypothetical protein
LEISELIRQSVTLQRVVAHHKEDLGSWVLQNVRSSAIGGAIIGVIFSAIFSVLAVLTLIADSWTAFAWVCLAMDFSASFSSEFASNALENAIDWSPKPHQYDSHEAFLNKIIGYAIFFPTQLLKTAIFVLILYFNTN